MPLEQHQSGPGNRISGPDGNEYDVVARVATDVGPFVIVNHAQDTGLSAGVLISEGDLRDHEDVAHVGLTSDAKSKAYAEAQQVEADQREADRQHRIASQAQAQATTDATDTTGGQGVTPPSPPTA